MPKVIFTDHAKCRIIERQIDTHTAVKAAKNPSYSKPGEDGTVIRSITLEDGRVLEVVCDDVPSLKPKKIVVRTVYIVNN